jgi:enoyl-CoA hydratase/carnithine racemase
MLAMSEGIRYERVGSAAVLTIDRPERRNAVDAATAEALRQGLTDFEADDGARVLILAGAGGEAFCAGADLKAMDLDVDHPHGPMGPTRLTPAKPAIAAVDGWCLAGGVELAICVSPPPPPPSASSSGAGACRSSTAAPSACPGSSAWAALSS